MDGTAKTLLLVEDHDVVAALEMRQLKALGFNVTHVLTGEKAIDEVFRKGDAIDLILMDVDLGQEMDGTTTAQIILSVFDIPIIFLSSHVEKEVVETTEKISSYGYVLKSAGIFVLAASIKMAFKLHDALLELRKVETYRRAEERRSKFHFENAPLAVIKWDADLIVTLWSHEAERIFGYCAREVLGRSIASLNLITEEDTPAAYRNMSKLVCGEERLLAFSNLNCTKSGEIIRCQWYNTVLADDDGRIASVTSLIQDLSRHPSETMTARQR